MNTERLHAIAIEILNEFNSTNFQNNFNQLVSALQNQVNQPQNPSFQNQVSNHLENLYSSLENAPSNNFSPTWKQSLHELGLIDLLGTSLLNKVKEIFERNQITPSIALKELQSINQELTTAKNSIEQITSSFEALEISTEELEPGNCEIGILIPRKAIKDKLDNFASDLEEINQIFGVFSELTIKSRPGFDIRSISSSELSIFISVLPVVGVAVVFAIERILGLYKQILEIRKLHAELKDQGISQKTLREIKNEANLIMKKGIDKTVKELMEKYYKKDDDGRKHELSNDLSFSLNNIAKRYDNGYSVEIRVTPLAEEGEDLKNGEVAHKNASDINYIIKESKNIDFIKLEGEPILTLPGPEEKKESKEKK